MLALPAGAGAAGQIKGQVQGAGGLPSPFRVTLWQAKSGAARPVALGSTMTWNEGKFRLRYRGATPRGTVRYLLAARPGGSAQAGYPVSVSSFALASTLGDRRVPRRATLNERTTVATAYSLAQFFSGNRVAGKNPGLRNAAAMTTNLVGRMRGSLSPVLRRFPNGRSTSTLRTFNSLANLVGLCRRPDNRCAKLLKTAGAPGGRSAANTLQAMVSIARYPWHNVRGLFRLSRAARQLYKPALGRGKRPAAWTLALRFAGVPGTLDGPGNIAIDAKGSPWVINNYEYSRDLRIGVCGGKQLLRFTPTGRGYPGSPYGGGGLNGAGLGVTFDPKGRIWVGNFGFRGNGCSETSLDNSVSLFSSNGRALSRADGYTAGNIYRPQGTVSDRKGNIWIANCGNNSVTRYPNGIPTPGSNLGTDTGLNRPFDIAVNAAGLAFVTSNGNAQIQILRPDGRPLANKSPVTGHGLNRPMGIATDSRGYVWVANSGKVIPPCKSGLFPGIQGGPSRGSTTLIEPDGDPARKLPFKGAGMRTPWGIAVDGNDTVWVANFTGHRVSQLCGARPKLCPPGKRRTGAAISPNGTGYAFNGLVRDTGLAIDPSGNVWLANNWKNVPVQTNPGGYQIVAFLGLAAPIRTPLIGPPERP